MLINIVVLSSQTNVKCSRSFYLVTIHTGSYSYHFYHSSFHSSSYKGSGNLTANTLTLNDLKIHLVHQ